ncbi:MAG: hypothetical protein V3R60_06635 [Acidobacteriota bacterium]
MEKTAFVTPGTLVRPGPIGRAVRLILGIFNCYWAYWFGQSPNYFVRSDTPDLSLFVGPAVAFWLLPPVVNLGFGVSWRRRSQGAVLLLAGAAALADFLLYGSFWGPPLGWVVFALTVYTFGHLGISFVLAALLGTPGCEMRSIPDLIGKATRRTALEHHCPGFITPLDNWEAQHR